MNVDDAIRARKTTKMLAQAALDSNLEGERIDELLRLAGWAPFHRACDESHRQDDLVAIEPWRFYPLNALSCRLLVERLPSENTGKIPAMLRAATSLILTTWLPNPHEQTTDVQKQAVEPVAQELFQSTLGNMEHIAAASAAIQNLLLAATARGIPSYWSSGGVLRSREVFEQLGISQREILLGAVFLFPEMPTVDQATETEVVGSKLREHRSLPGKFMRWVELR